MSGVWYHNPEQWVPPESSAAAVGAAPGAARTPEQARAIIDGICGECPHGRLREHDAVACGLLKACCSSRLWEHVLRGGGCVDNPPRFAATAENAAISTTEAQRHREIRRD